MEPSSGTGQTASAVNGLRELMRKHPLFSFFFMAYAFSWIISLPYVLSAWGLLPGNYMVLFILKPFVGPTLAAIIMTGILEGKAGLSRLRKRLSHRQGAAWFVYVAILLGFPALLMIGLFIQPGPLAAFQGLTPKALISYPIYLVIVYFGVGMPEEIGWRGFALPRLQPRYGPMGGTLILGALWAFWHLLYFFTPDHGGGPGTGPLTYVMNFGLFFLMVMALTVILTWIFNHTGGSIFMAILAHASIDTPQLTLVPLFVGLTETNLNLAVLSTSAVVAVLIIIFTRGRLGYHADQPEPGGIPAEIAARPVG